MSREQTQELARLRQRECAIQLGMLLSITDLPVIRWEIERGGSLVGLVEMDGADQRARVFDAWRHRLTLTETTPIPIEHGRGARRRAGRVHRGVRMTIVADILDADRRWEGRTGRPRRPVNQRMIG